MRVICRPVTHNGPLITLIFVVTFTTSAESNQVEPACGAALALACEAKLQEQERAIPTRAVASSSPLDPVQAVAARPEVFAVQKSASTEPVRSVLAEPCAAPSLLVVVCGGNNVSVKNLQTWANARL
jgi:hypothetical protein